MWEGYNFCPVPKPPIPGIRPIICINMHNGFAIMQVLTTVYQTNMVSFHPIWCSSHALSQPLWCSSHTLWFSSHQSLCYSYPFWCALLIHYGLPIYLQCRRLAAWLLVCSVNGQPASYIFAVQKLPIVLTCEVKTGTAALASIYIICTSTLDHLTMTQCIIQSLTQPQTTNLQSM